MENKKIFILGGFVVFILLVLLGLMLYLGKRENSFSTRPAGNAISAAPKANQDNFSYEKDKRVISFLGTVKNVSGGHLSVEANFSGYVDSNVVQELDVSVGNSTDIVRSSWNSEKGENEFSKADFSEIKENDFLTIFPQDINFLTEGKSTIEAKRIEIEQFYTPGNN